MKKPIARLLAVSLGLSLAALAAEAVSPIPLWRFALLGIGEARLAHKASDCHARALTEVEGLADHPYAGLYRTAGRWPLEMVLAPTAGITLYQHSSCGNCTGWRGVGRLEQAETSILHFELDLGCNRPLVEMSSSRWWCRDTNLQLVAWGDLQFAVPVSMLEEFYRDVNDGHSFPRAPFRQLVERPGFDFVDPAQPEGRPEIVPGHEHLLLQQPVHCRVIGVVEKRPRVNSDDCQDVCYAIDAGSRAGLTVGARVYFEGTHELSGRRARVELVQPDTSHVLVLAVKQAASTADNVVGSAISTLHPEAGARHDTPR